MQVRSRHFGQCAMIVGAVSVVAVMASSQTRLNAQADKKDVLLAKPVVVQADYVGVSKPVRGIKPLGPVTGEPKARSRRNIRNPKVKDADASQAQMAAEVDGAIQTTAPTVAMPGPGLTFDGADITDCGCAPPDTNIEVGPNHVVEMVNVRARIFNKAGGLLAGPISLAALWSSAGFTDQCATGDDGDPVVLYDQLADRWIMSQFAVRSFPNRECVAVSKTPDPTGQWYLYSFAAPNPAVFADYPKLGTWPDAYYMTTNQFNTAGTAFLGTGVYAYERERMLRGDPAARLVYFDLSPAAFPEFIAGMLPADLDGYTPPPAGAPNPFVYFTATLWGDPANGLRIFNFHADWTNPASSTFTEFGTSYAAPLPVAPFDPRYSTGSQIPQPGTTSGLDAISDRLMHRLQYRNFGSHQTLVTNHTVNVGTGSSLSDYQGAPRWYELRRTAGPWSVRQQGTFAPDQGVAPLTSRWMGSAAMDASGNLAVGYSKSSSSIFPSLAYAGRLSADPAGQLTQGEATMFAGLGSQSATNNRWGDYSNLAVDPDDCTFWYTNEYYPAGVTSFNWRTRIGRFSFGPGACTPPSLGTVTANVTACSGGTPIQGAAVSVGGVLYGSTSSAGTSSAKLAPGTYTMTASRPDLSSDTKTVTVTGGSTQTVNFCLTTSPIISVDAASLTAEGCSPPNGAVDPDERVTYSLTLKNTGLAATVNLVATLQAGPNVSAPSAPQNYGVIAPGASATRSFSWTAVGTCGDPWSAAFALTDPGSTLPNVSIGNTFGALVTTTAYSQAFDGVTAPALPAGWTAVNPIPGDGILWVTSTSAPDTAPNAAFVNDPIVISDKLLLTPTIAMPAGSMQLRFRNKHTLETGYDGGVLEVSVNGGAFQDIIAAGGSFVSGGYNATISTSFGSPIGGRQAWTGSQASFFDTVINLPASFASQNVQFRFRMASDNSVSSTGWWVDTLSVGGTVRTCVTCAQPNLQLTFLKPPTAGAPGGTIAIKDTTTNSGAGSAGPSTTRFWLSTNKTLGGDTLFGSRAVGSLAAGASSTVTTSVSLPVVAPGVYYVIAEADGGAGVAESDEADNTRFKAITIGPDLLVSKIVFSPDPPARTGSTISVTTKNKGGVTTGVTTLTRVYRSADSKFDAGDTLLGTISVPALAPNAVFTGTVSPTLPGGTYYFIAVVDATNLVAEAKEGIPNQKKVQKIVP